MLIENNFKQYGNTSKIPSGLTIINDLVSLPIFCSPFISACPFKLASLSLDSFHSNPYHSLL